MSKTIPEVRYQICSDNSGHEYFIAVDFVNVFYKWAEDEDPEDPNLYDDYRIDGHFTFANPRCD